MTAELFGETLVNPQLDGWNGLGIAVQAYGKRAIPLLRWLRRVAEQNGKRIPVRLVKGAYWDSEIKWAQERGLVDYPVFSRKLHTDVSYLAAMRLLLSDPVAFYPQFATHNAHTIASAFVAGGAVEFEFQRLHGMGEALYEQVVGDTQVQRGHAVSTRPSAATRICSPIWFAACSRTAPTRRSSTGSATMKCRFREIIARSGRDRRSRVRFRRTRAAHYPAARHIHAGSQEQRRARACRGERAPDAAGRHRRGSENALRGRDRSSTARRRPAAMPRQLVICSARSSRAHRHGTPRDAATPRRRRLAAATNAARRWEQTEATERARILEIAAELFERDRAALMAVHCARSRQDARSGAVRRARGCRLSALLCDRGAAAVLRARPAARPDGRRATP